MSTDRLYALIGAALIVAAFLLGRYAWPSRRALELAMTRSGPAGEICRDCGGWCQPCDCCLTDLEEMDDDERSSVGVPHGPGESRIDLAAGSDARPALVPGRVPAGELDTVPATQPRDLWSEPLSPSQERAAHALDLPGPESPSTGAPDRAGESHETPLPAILQLGTEGDGTDRTFTRVRLRQMTMLTEFERDQAALMASCGLTYRGLVAA